MNDPDHKGLGQRERPSKVCVLPCNVLPALGGRSVARSAGART
jgi:hypothetical protein